MTNLERLNKVVSPELTEDLLDWLLDFAYWADGGGWFDPEMIRLYLGEEVEEDENDTF